MKRPAQITNYSIVNKGNKTADVYIDGVIVDAETQEFLKAYFGDSTSVSYKSFRNEINALDATTYNVYVSGPGGHVGDALAMHDLLVDMQNKGTVVNTIGRGIVASALTFVLLAGKKPSMSPNSWLMVHTVSGGTYGTVKQVENYAATMRKFNDKAVSLYVSKSNITEEKINELMEAETYMTAQEAEEHGFIKVEGENVALKNKISEEEWPFENKAILNLHNAFVNNNQPENTEIMKLLKDLKGDILAAIKAVNPPATATPAEIVQLVADALAAPFENMEEAVNAAVTTHTQEMVNTAVTTAVNAAVTLAVKTAVEAATKPLTDQIATMQDEVANFVGGESKDKSKIDPKAKVIGSFD